MSAIGRTSLVVVGAAAIAAVLWWLFQPAAPDAEAVVQDAVRSALGDAAVLNVEYSEEAENWVLLCGTISGPDGAGPEALSDAAREILSESADFCALVEASEPVNLRELDMGSTDMPAMDWMDKYGLPPELLTSE